MMRIGMIDDDADDDVEKYDHDDDDNDNADNDDEYDEYTDMRWKGNVMMMIMFKMMILFML